MRILLLSLSLVTGTTSLSAQDTIEKTKPFQKRYPSFKLVTIQKDYFGDSDYKVYSKNGDLEHEGELSSNRFNISAIIPLYSKNKLSMHAGITYTRESTAYFNKTAADLYHKSHWNTNDFDAAFSVMYKGKLFNRPIFHRVSVLFGSSNFIGIKKLTGSFSTSMILKASSETLTTLGAFVNLDQSSLVPFFPLFSYWHKFNNSLWELDAVLPQKMIFRRSGVLNGWVSTGVELNGNSFFLKQDARMQFRAGNYEWLSTDIYMHLGYDYLLGKNLLLGLKGGYKNSLSTRLIKVNEKVNDYRSRTKISAPFFNINAAFVIK